MHRRSSKRLTRVLTIVVIPFAATAGQGPTTLSAPNAALNATFTRVTAARELSDGRVLVVDEGDNRLVIVDFAAGSVRQVGREGSGVGEYRAVRRLAAIGADSSIVADPANGRWLLIARDSIVAILGPGAAVVRAIGGSPLGADSLGFVIGTRPRVIDGTPRLDSLNLLRGSRRDANVDTITTLLNRRPNLPSGRIDPTQAVAISFNPLASGEQAAMFLDGWIAIVRLRPYRIEWVQPDGRRLTGPPLPFESIRVDDREKSAAVQREADETGQPPRDINVVGEWPAVVPAFLSNAVLPAPDGSVWIQRTPSRNQPATRYDVVDRRGTLVRSLSLDASERIVGFGRRSVYTVRVDADGLQKLRRHALSPWKHSSRMVTVGS